MSDPQQSPTAPTVVSPLRVGTVVARRYTLVQPLGAGGSGEVWLASERFGDAATKKVAIKVFAGREYVARDSFLREISALVELKHENICHARAGDYDQDLKRYWYAMEFADGGSLAQRRFAGQRLRVSQALLWLREAVEAMDTAERAKRVHCDIKPGNLLLETVVREGVPRERLLVADFGISCEIKVGTQQDQAGYTPGYASPEQVRNDQPLSSATDQYSLGVTFYQLLTGAMPPQDAKPPFDPGTLRRGLPEGLRQVLRQMTEENPAERFECFAAVRAALQGVVAHRPIRPWGLVVFSFVAGAGLVGTSLLRPPSSVEAVAPPTPSGDPTPPKSSGEPTPAKSSEESKPTNSVPVWAKLPSGDVLFRGKEWRLIPASGNYHDAIVAAKEASDGVAEPWRLPSVGECEDIQQLVEAGAIANQNLPFWCGKERPFRATVIILSNGDFSHGERDKSESCSILLTRRG